ncbi:hypothetical protein QFC20_007202 [Naganishia adeliensis]|uniref:Uncharacterized protein n=1 Tax=Naganishia adeliensis TaxID=92952 RepID=A0ACC2V1T9_9TREE|nr:hypothetical protein QFC20_007202 [Naganishia adeliensis]
MASSDTGPTSWSHTFLRMVYAATHLPIQDQIIPKENAKPVISRLRGILYLRLNQLQLAKQSFMEALALDVRNFDVFLELTNSMMTVEEEWHFIQNLSYRDQLHSEDAAFLLADHYNLEENADMRFLDAERSFAASDWDACYTITSSAYLPVMCIGMEYIQLNDMPMALNALSTALSYGVEDPLLFNEIGIVHFNQEQLLQQSYQYPLGLANLSLHACRNLLQHGALSKKIQPGHRALKLRTV